MGFAALHVYMYVMYQNILEWSTVDCLIAYKVAPTAYHICFHHKTTTLVYVLKDRVIHSLYAPQINSVNVFYSPMSILFSLIYSVSYYCVCYCTSLTNICGFHLLF